MFTSGVKIAAIRWQNHTSTHELTSILIPSQLLSHMMFLQFLVVCDGTTSRTGKKLKSAPLISVRQPDL